MEDMNSQLQQSEMAHFKDNEAVLTINGKVYSVPEANTRVEMSLNSFIREIAHLTGTKFMCKEGGCGCCVVNIEFEDPYTKETRSHAVNSCLVPVLACHGKAITTIEGIGSKRTGYHPLQKTLAKFNGTQCGFCSPGMVMNMYSLLKNNPKLMMEEVEKSFGGNICRCTGYRPILDAFKSFATDATKDLQNKCQDIEDVSLCGKNCSEHCLDFIEMAFAPKILKINSNNKIWYKVSTVDEIMQLFDEIGDASYQLLAGNTAKGAYPLTIQDRPRVYIDINDVAELKSKTIKNESVQIGANTTLSDAMTLFGAVSKENPLYFKHLNTVAKHLELVANIPVRNIGTLAGNLMLKYKHNDFPSDVYLLMELIGASLVINDRHTFDKVVPISNFLGTNMNQKVIKTIILPGISSKHYTIRSYKIMPRKQNVHAVVNAGFLFRLNKLYIVEEKPKILFGGIEPNFLHANRTERYLTGANLLNSLSLQQALKYLSSELNPNNNPPEASPLYRKNLALSIFYKFVLKLGSTLVKRRYQTGADILKRPLSSGRQDFTTNPKMYPVNQPVEKLEARDQTSGEAIYVQDMQDHVGQLFGAFVLADKPAEKILSINPSGALNMSGVVAFFSGKDIPGENTFAVPHSKGQENREIFAIDKVLYYGQPLGIVVAESQELANDAANFVKVVYSDFNKPLLNIKDVLNSEDSDRLQLQGQIKPTADFSNEAQYEINGEFYSNEQYHFSMETQVCHCVPTEQGAKIFSSTQWMRVIQESVAKALNLNENQVEVEVKRVGGGFGAKLASGSLLANACALATLKLNRPVRMVLDLRTNMTAIGKRYQIYSKYKIKTNEFGKILRLDMTEYIDNGAVFNNTVRQYYTNGVKNTYDFSTWKVDLYGVKTDHVFSVPTRGQGTVQSIYLIEHIMEHISSAVKREPLSVRLANTSRAHNSVIQDMLNSIKLSSDYQYRRNTVDKMNGENRWRKRGISILPLNYVVDLFHGYNALVSIYSDGSVSIQHGGCEIGQGVNTKAAQVCAYALGIDLNLVNVKSSNTIVSPNSQYTGGSVTSELICYCVLESCKELVENLKPLKEKMGNPAWPDLVYAASLQGIQLSSTKTYTDIDILEYSVYAVCVLEIELDVLTGQYQILRADILEDTGESLSPIIDIGQIEGGFIMGLGYFSSEQTIYDGNGKILTNRTWNYWPPCAQDIPIDFRISLRQTIPNPVGVLSSKATGEPPTALACALMLALRQAVISARKDAGLKDDWFDYGQPCTFEKTFLLCGNNYQQYLL